jgi:GT2 family glycosyltransferase
MITLAIPTYRRFDLLTDCIASAMAGTLPPDKVLIIDNSGGDCPPISGATIVPGRQPQSVAKAWNDAASLVGSQGWLILANDDITFAPETIERLVTTAQQQPKAGMVSPIEGARFACFLLRYSAFLQIGPFDEAFRMAYFEDNDYAWRLTLNRWGLAVAPSAVAHVGSATLARLTPEQMRVKHAAYAHNAEYFARKWGGPPHAEIYSTPFGGVAQ